MADSATHQLVGAIAAGGATGLYLLATKRPLTSKNLLKVVAGAALAGAVGYGAGRLPDVLEPVTSPTHRQFFHSIAFLALLSGLNVWAWNRWARAVAGSLSVASLAYASHLLFDSATPYGLPWIAFLWSGRTSLFVTSLVLALGLGLVLRAAFRRRLRFR